VPRLGRTDGTSAAAAIWKEPSPVKRIHIGKRRPRPAGRRQEPLPLDLRDPDIVKAHQLARNASLSGHRQKDA
jgi:hypothetical protein